MSASVEEQKFARAVEQVRVWRDRKGELTDDEIRQHLNFQWPRSYNPDWAERVIAEVRK